MSSFITVIKEVQSLSFHLLISDSNCLLMFFFPCGSRLIHYYTMFQTPRPSTSKQPIPSGMAGMPGILGPVPSPHLLRTPRTPVRAGDPFSVIHTDPGEGTLISCVINFIIHMFNIGCLNLDKKRLL